MEKCNRLHKIRNYPHRTKMSSRLLILVAKDVLKTSQTGVKLDPNLAFLRHSIYTVLNRTTLSLFINSHATRWQSFDPDMDVCNWGETKLLS